MRKLDPGAIAGVDVRVVARCGSTNSVLLAQCPARPVLLVAETQTAGRGRRGRRWLSAPRGAALTFSLAAPFKRPLRELPPLAPAVGVALAGVLRKAGIRRVGVKWPNDLMVAGAKLGGILIETRSARGATCVVIGVGINFASAPRLSRRVACVADFTRTYRNALLRRCALALVHTVERFERFGFAPFARDWQRFDQPVSGRAYAEGLA
jgi:BirA family transcriptional regulator, biotin operon repressor / biotin---[acetyl-CoA-carboxylase] ligase